jgi:hypothetical protein
MLILLPLLTFFVVLRYSDCNAAVHGRSQPHRPEREPHQEGPEGEVGSRAGRVGLDMLAVAIAEHVRENCNKLQVPGRGFALSRKTHTWHLHPSA